MKNTKNHSFPKKEGKKMKEKNFLKKIKGKKKKLYFYDFKTNNSNFH